MIKIAKLKLKKQGEADLCSRQPPCSLAGSEEHGGSESCQHQPQAHPSRKLQLHRTSQRPQILHQIRKRQQHPARFNHFLTQTINPAEVARALKQTKPTQLQGQTTSCRQTLKYGAEQLGGVFQHLFQSSLTSSTAATCDVETVNSYSYPKEGHHQDSEGPQTCGSHFSGYEDHAEGYQRPTRQHNQPYDGPAPVCLLGLQRHRRHKDIYLKPHPQTSGSS